MLRRIAVAPALLLALGACTVGPDFAPPEWLSPASWFAKKAEADPEGTQYAGYGSDRSELVERVQAIPSLRSWSIALPARTSTCRSPRRGSPNPARSLAMAGAAQFPTLNANGSYARQKSSNIGVFSNAPNALGANGALGNTAGGLKSWHLNPFDVYQVGFDASWELDLWGGVRRR